MRMRYTFAAAAIALAVGSSAASAATNLALLTEGASFVSASSIIAPGTYGLTIDAATMQSNLLTDPPVPPAITENGDVRYIFGTNDPDQQIVIKLGSLSDLTSIGATVDIPAYGDRVVSDFSVSVSADGNAWTNFGSAVALDGSSLNPIMVSGAASGVQYVRYDFGPAISCCGGGGGGAVFQVFADGAAVPEPATWAMFVIGFGGVGFMLRRPLRNIVVPFS